MVTKAKEKKITITQKTPGGAFTITFDGLWQAKEIPRIQSALIKAYRTSKVTERRLAKLAEAIVKEA